MSNNYFQFKEFRVEQDRCAMKVSTDACIQGAWTPVPPTVRNVLDIGAGTGLLSLMLAQRNAKVKIGAVEIDSAAASQARENVQASAWKDRIRVTEADARMYESTDKYDLIICNPPFFINSLLGGRRERNTARHSLLLSFEELFRIIRLNLSADGFASILLPVPEFRLWEELLAGNGWTIFHRLNIVPVTGRKANRIVGLCRPEPAEQHAPEELIIRNGTNDYTPEFIHLMKPFYLNF